MKARVKATGEILTIVKNIGYPGGYVASDGRTYSDDNLTLIVDEDPDYWTRLEHQAAIAAMQGILAKYGMEPLPDDLINDACEYAHALVKRMKEVK